VDETHKKVFLKMTQIARMRIRGYKDGIIASHFGLSQSGLARIISDPTYIEIQAQVLETVNAGLDAGLKNDHDELKRKFEKYVPFAMQALIDTVMQSRDLKMKMEAAKEIFDRDPNKSFAKADKTGQSAGATALPTGLMSQLDAENKTVVSNIPKPTIN